MDCLFQKYLLDVYFIYQMITNFNNYIIFYVHIHHCSLFTIIESELTCIKFHFLSFQMPV